MFHNISCYKYKNVILFVQGFNIFFVNFYTSLPLLYYCTSTVRIIWHSYLTFIPQIAITIEMSYEFV